MKQIKSFFYSLFFIVLLTTEFYYIEVGGGIARIYHFMAVLIVLFLITSVPRLFKSPVLWALLVFIVVNLIAVSLSDSPSQALASFSSFLANIGIAIATALILITKQLDLTVFKRVILIITLISVAFGLIQIIGGVRFALSLEQESQISIGFGPGFRTESNTFGKFLLFPFLLFLPDYIKYRNSSAYNWTYLVFLIGILMNFTRSSIYGLLIAFIFMTFWYSKTYKFKLLLKGSSKIIIVAGIGIALIIGGVANVSEYATYKIEKLFDQEEILEGDSSTYRIDTMQAVIDSTLSDNKKTIIGNGWGQTFVYIAGVEQQAGGGDSTNVFGYSGIIGLLGYLVYSLTTLLTAIKAARFEQDSEKRQLAEGIVFAIIGMFVTSQTSGLMITPEYWMLIGISIYLSINARNYPTFKRIRRS